ncbi:Phosphatidylserine/phosphatidylglycerophosphate/cardiolipin synthase [Halopseudomonas xinjiangensis]|uniref:phospholipase D n=1 Tax=Halopseudomonas xinjiangensis TaxID=487184 RepID=A0A1H1YDU3_9GAMM|nr:phospholipase D family protein [Halopseudomonas xinjiangensis]SDT19623.1 Phosphatidylserine/phosphatidylglycerophosphate/cardiolipin synthase [Halopseudomonas xinjiangensis]
MDELRRTSPRRWLRALLGLLLLAWLGMACYQAFKPLPAGLSFTGPLRPASDMQLLMDQTYHDGQRRITEQQVFDEAFALIGQARRLIVVDMFLFNDFAAKAEHRPLSRQLTEALLAARRQHADIEIVVITDPFNTFYGSMQAPAIEALEEAGIRVVMTPVSKLRASNPAWSGLWHICCSWLGNSEDGGWLPNPVAEGKVTLRGWLRLLNFRANHRKTLIVDQGNDWVGLVTSANPHDASSHHWNAALRFSGAAALDLLASEQAVLNMANAEVDWPQPPDMSIAVLPAVQILTEGAIRDGLLRMVDSSEAGDRLDMEMFYLSHRPIIKALINAHKRGVELRVLLDPNRDAFGREKNGIPNRQAAWDLHEAGIPVRWCDTQGEQCHRKWVRLEHSDGIGELISGSANLTRRNLDDLNLETSVRLVAQHDESALVEAREHFQRLWTNAEGKPFSLPYDAFADHSRLRYWLYRWMEATGMSTF